MVSGFVTSPWLQLRIFFEEARPISMASKLLMSICPSGSLFLYLRLFLGAGAVRAAALSLGDHLLLALVGRTGAVAPLGAHAGEVDAELLGRPQQLVVLLAQVHRPLLGDQVHVEAEALDLLQQNLERLGDRGLRDVLGLDD